MKLFPLMLSFLMLAACAKDSPDNDVVGDEAGIVNGQVAKTGQPEITSVVMIVRKSGPEQRTTMPDGSVETHQPIFTCTGTLIAENTVITAAHCVLEEDGKTAAKAEDMFIYFGLEPLKNPDIVLQVTKVLPHPKYDAKAEYSTDLGLLRFSGPRPAGTTIASLPSKADNNVSLSSWIAVGYGLTNGRAIDDSNPADSGILRVAAIKNVRPFINQYAINDFDGTGACFGDSGGPGFVRRADGSLVLAGVYSGNLIVKKTADGKDVPPPADKCQSGSTYTNVGIDVYLKWIQDFIKAN